MSSRESIINYFPVVAFLHLLIVHLEYSCTLVHTRVNLFTQPTVAGDSKNKNFNRLFKRFAGDDNVVDFKELQKILNKGFISG